MTALRMGTRGSALARAQSSAAAAELTARTGVEVEVVLIKTEGDHLSSEGKAPPGGDATGVFTRALDEALRDGRIDFAVHSLKDVPTEAGVAGPAGAAYTDLVVAAVPERADARDALVVSARHPGIDTLTGLPEAARVSTSSPRRVAQLLRLRPDLVMQPMAGNVDTRLRKLDEGEADALLLACAGLDRLSLAGRITSRLEAEEMLGAPGQGALAFSCRTDDTQTRLTLSAMDHPETRAAVEAERSFLATLRGGCRAPVGAFCEEVDGSLVMAGRVLSLAGDACVEGFAYGELHEAADVGRRLANDLLSKGAERLVDAAREALEGPGRK